MDEDLSIKHAIKNSSACSVGAAASCISASKVLQKTKGKVIDYYTSYDVMKSNSFVGYVGMVF
jgi:AmmeMemoRadiSam system protein B